MKNAVIAATIAAIVAAPTGYSFGRDTVGISNAQTAQRISILEKRMSYAEKRNHYDSVMIRKLRKWYNEDAAILTDLACRHILFEDGSTLHADAEDDYLPCMWGDVRR